MLDKKNESFKLGASYTIGSHILPGEPIALIGKEVARKISLNITSCDQIIDGVKDGTFDLGLIETPIFDNGLIYKEWMEDELVVCSKMPIPPKITQKEIETYRLIARKEDSLTRLVITKFLKELNLSYKSFHSISEIDNATAAIQSIKWSKPNPTNPTVAIVSQLAIEDELKNNLLYIARLEKLPMIRKFYLIYNPKHQDTQSIERILSILKKLNKNTPRHSPLLAS